VKKKTRRRRANGRYVSCTTRGKRSPIEEKIPVYGRKKKNQAPQTHVLERNNLGSGKKEKKGSFGKKNFPHKKKKNDNAATSWTIHSLRKKKRKKYKERKRG